MPKSLNVLLVASSYLPNLGGLQSITSELARELLRRSNQVQVLTQKYPRVLPGLEMIDGIRVQRWHFVTPRLRDLPQGRVDLFVAALFLFPITLARLVWRIARAKPDVVNLHFVGAPALFLLIARKLLRFRLVVSLHGDDVEGLPHGTRFDRWVFRAILHQADAVTTCSRYLLDRAEEIEPSIAHKACVIHNGLDFSPAFVEGAKRNGQSQLLAIGRMTPVKGFDLLVRAFASIHDDAIYLKMIGDGSERSRLELLAHDLGMNGKIEFSGSLNQKLVRDEIAASSFVVIPSRRDSFSLVALEAMASGKPVIAARVGGLPEVLEEADSILVDADNPTALAQAVNQMLARLKQEPTYGKRNRELASRFSLSRMVKHYEEVYSGCCVDEV